MLNTTKSEELYKVALDLMPGGVNSPVRAFGAVGRNPLFIDHAKGSYVYDVDGNKFIDYVWDLEFLDILIQRFLKK